MEISSSELQKIIQSALSKYYIELQENAFEYIPDSLPLVEKYLEQNNASYESIDVLFIQHHLGPLVPRIKAMNKYGLDYSKCWFVDIPYSTNDTVRVALTELGCPKEQMVEPFNDPITPYSRRQTERVEYLVQELAYSSNSKVLVIDDGAYFVKALNRLSRARSQCTFDLLLQVRPLIWQQHNPSNQMESTTSYPHVFLIPTRKCFLSPI